MKYRNTNNCTKCIIVLTPYKVPARITVPPIILQLRNDCLLLLESISCCQSFFDSGIESKGVEECDVFDGF